MTLLVALALEIGAGVPRGRMRMKPKSFIPLATLRTASPRQLSAVSARRSRDKCWHPLDSPAKLAIVQITSETPNICEW